MGQKASNSKRLKLHLTSYPFIVKSLSKSNRWFYIGFTLCRLSMEFRVIIMDYGCIDYLLYLKLKNYFSDKKGVGEIFLFYTSNLVKWSLQIKPYMSTTFGYLLTLHL